MSSDWVPCGTMSSEVSIGVIPRFTRDLLARRVRTRAFPVSGQEFDSVAHCNCGLQMLEELLD